MALKKINNDEIIDSFSEAKKIDKTKVDEFIAGADTKSESKPKKRSRIKNLDGAINTCLSNELSLIFKKRIKGIYSLNSFLALCLLNELDYFSNSDIVFIYEKSRSQSTSMGEFVKFKLGIIDEMKPSLPIQHRSANKMIYISKEEKRTIENIAMSLRLNLFRYSEIKYIACNELNGVLSSNDILRLNKEAREYGMDLKDYISIRVKG